MIQVIVNYFTTALMNQLNVFVFEMDCFVKMKSNLNLLVALGIQIDIGFYTIAIRRKNFAKKCLYF